MGGVSVGDKVRVKVMVPELQRTGRVGDVLGLVSSSRGQGYVHVAFVEGPAFYHPDELEVVGDAADMGDPDLHGDGDDREAEAMDLADEEARRRPDAAARLAAALRLVLPLAKGYAAAHRHPVNDECIAEAEAALAATEPK